MFKLIFSFLLLLPLIIGCSGVQTFPNMARAGDTVSVSMGWQKRFKRSNTTITITPSMGAPIIYQPNDPAIRAIINFYPDPLSNIVIGTKEGDDTFFRNGNTYGSLINSVHTEGDMDWWQTVAFIDLPSTLQMGEVNIELINTDGDIANSLVNIIEGTGDVDVFNAEGLGPMNHTQLTSLERASNYEVSIISAIIPYAVEFEFTYNAPNVSFPYTEKAIVVNPNVVKNVVTSDDGVTLKVMVVPASLAPLTSLQDFKFYISGSAVNEALNTSPGLTLNSLKAYDVDGNVIAGVSESIVQDLRF